MIIYNPKQGADIRYRGFIIPLDTKMEVPDEFAIEIKLRYGFIHLLSNNMSMPQDHFDLRKKNSSFGRKFKAVLRKIKKMFIK